MVFPTLRRCAPGFWRKTIDEFSRSAQIAVKLEALSVPTAPRPLLNFSDPDTITWMKTMSDRSVRGSSTAQLAQVPASTDDQTGEDIPTHLLFHGDISTKLPPDRPDVKRTGYAAFRNQDRGRSAFGKLYWDVDSYTYLALRVKSDGRRYFVNIQTESLVETDIHQHRLYTRLHKGAPAATSNGNTGQWETVLIKFHEFVRTNYGVVAEPQSEMLRQKITSFGIGLTDRQPGPFELAIGAMWATNLNERGLLDGQTTTTLGGARHDTSAAPATIKDGVADEEDLGSATLSEVTEEKLIERAEERARLPEVRPRLRDRIPSHFGKVGTEYRTRPGGGN